MGLRYSILVVILMAFLATPSRAAYDSLRTEKHKGQMVVVHLVEQSETLYSLSRRYGSAVREIVKFNKIEGNTISLGQELLIPIGKIKSKKSKSGAVSVNGDPETEAEVYSLPQDSAQKTHIVKSKETLFAISRMYGLTVDELKQLNGLESNSLNLGQVLNVSTTGGETVVSIPEEEEEEEVEIEKSVAPGFNEYLVQSGDMLETIARKFNVRPDSIVIWNQLSNTYLAIGQRLVIKGEVDSLVQMTQPEIEETGYSQKSKMIDASGFAKVLEEGVAKKIENVVETDKYLAMHRTLKVGSMIEVRNLMNNKKVFVRVVGRLPNTGLNQNTLIRLTPICFSKLGVIDPTARVEISYYEE
ncbi:MAG: LysM peptidoglycan-binding domain-containing protein [Cyclobacteriaceae bacterium]